MSDRRASRPACIAGVLDWQAHPQISIAGGGRCVGQEEREARVFREPAVGGQRRVACEYPEPRLRDNSRSRGFAPASRASSVAVRDPLPGNVVSTNLRLGPSRRRSANASPCNIDEQAEAGELDAPAASSALDKADAEKKVFGLSVGT